MIERYSGVLFGQGENAEGLVVREKDSPEAARAALLRGGTDLPDGTRLVVWKQRRSQFDRDCAIAIEEESEGFSRSSYRRRVEYAQEMIRRTGGRPPQNNRPPTLAIAASRRIREKLDELAAAGVDWVAQCEIISRLSYELGSNSETIRRGQEMVGVETKFGRELGKRGFESRRRYWRTRVKGQAKEVAG